MPRPTAPRSTDRIEVAWVQATQRVRRGRVRTVAHPEPLTELAVWLPMILLGAAVGLIAKLM